MSKCLFVFSYNDEQLVNPILKDRMVTIEIEGYEKEEKLVIARDYLIPEIQNEYRMQGDLWTDELILYLIHQTEKESGVRNLKRNLDKVYSHLNLLRILEKKEQTITKEWIEERFPSLREETFSSMYL
jgi:ATP-dependent Lon protease